MPETPDISTVDLSNDEAAVLAEIQKAVKDLEQQAQGVFRLIYRQHGLTGNWALKGNQLVRTDNGVE